MNVSLTIRNWLIGFYIVEFEQKGEDRATYGLGLLNKLSAEIKIKGLVQAELSRCRQFYFCYAQILGLLTQEFKISFSLPISGVISSNYDVIKDKGIYQSKVFTKSKNNLNIPVDKLIEKLSYTHLIELIKIQDKIKRSFYEIECIKGTWSVRELKRQINGLYYERNRMSNKLELLKKITKQKTESSNITDIVKSLYAFEFLGLNAKDAIEENDLESALLNNLQIFMLEMGYGFCLEARQKKIIIGDEYFFIDLVFYHRILKCHVLVELKVGNFNHHNIGQLNAYVNYYKAEEMQPDDKPTIGILLVTNKNNALIEYATAGMDNQLFVSKYLLELPNKETLEDFIKNELQNWK